MMMIKSGSDQDYRKKRCKKQQTTTDTKIIHWIDLAVFGLLFVYVFLFLFLNFKQKLNDLTTTKLAEKNSIKKNVRIDHQINQFQAIRLLLILSLKIWNFFFFLFLNKIVFHHYHGYFIWVYFEYKMGEIHICGGEICLWTFVSR